MISILKIFIGRLYSEIFSVVHIIGFWYLSYAKGLFQITIAKHSDSVRELPDVWFDALSVWKPYQVLCNANRGGPY